MAQGKCEVPNRRERQGKRDKPNSNYTANRQFRYFMCFLCIIYHRVSYEGGMRCMHVCSKYQRPCAHYILWAYIGPAGRCPPLRIRPRPRPMAQFQGSFESGEVVGCQVLFSTCCFFFSLLLFVFLFHLPLLAMTFNLRFENHLTLFTFTPLKLMSKCQGIIRKTRVIIA